LEKALEIGNVIYSIHNAGSADFVRGFIAGRGTVTDIVTLKFPIRHTFKFHTKEIAHIDVELYRILSNRK